MNEDIIIRSANKQDIDFLVDTIVFAEKSGTDVFGLANLFGCTEEKMRYYIGKMLEEEIDGCEFSISSFVVAEYQGRTVSALGGWIEGQNESGLPSAILKSNLVGYCLPVESILKSQSMQIIVGPIQIPRERETYQLEYAYTIPDYRGKGFLGCIFEWHLKKALSRGVRKMQLHVFANNIPAIKSYEKLEFKEVGRFVSGHGNTTQYYPSNTILLMERDL